MSNESGTKLDVSGQVLLISNKVSTQGLTYGSNLENTESGTIVENFDQIDFVLN
jgi:hypothetical protein